MQPLSVSAALLALFKYLFDAAPGSKPNVLKLADVIRSVVLAFSSGGLASAVAVVLGVFGPQAVAATSIVVPAIAFLLDLIRRYRHADATSV